MLPTNSKPVSLCSYSESQENIDEWIKYTAKCSIAGSKFLISVYDFTWTEIVTDVEFNWLCCLRLQLSSFDLVVTDYSSNSGLGFMEEETSYEAFIFDF